MCACHRMFHWSLRGRTKSTKCRLVQHFQLPGYFMSRGSELPYSDSLCLRSSPGVLPPHLVGSLMPKCSLSPEPPGLRHSPEGSESMAQGKGSSDTATRAPSVQKSPEQMPSNYRVLFSGWGSCACFSMEAPFLFPIPS